MTVHFIAIGGAVMNNLAISLRNIGYKVTGSDDEIFNPAKTNLKIHNLLPNQMGWFPEKIHKGIDAVILGMHAKADNPELVKAKQLGLKIFSFPEYVYNQSENKTRVVIGGSHGKTTITSMILHVLNFYEKKFDYLVGAKLKGFDLMVQITNAPIIILEGDEYLSSALDRRPKFHLYKPHIALLSGIAWDHINVFPTFSNYLEQFKMFVDTIKPGGHLIYFEGDEHLKDIAENAPANLHQHPYSTPTHTITNHQTILKDGEKEYPLYIIGEHNLQNMEGARLVCEQLGINKNDFLKAIQSFEGAAKRMELLGENESKTIFKDFAHSPSKLKATINAVKQQYTDRKLIACMELHTYSSLNKTFLQEYKGCMKQADVPVIYFDNHAIEIKKLEAITEAEIKTAFDDERLIIFNSSDALRDFITSQTQNNCNLLMMSSGNFGGIDLEELAEEVLR